MFADKRIIVYLASAYVFAADYSKKKPQLVKFDWDGLDPGKALSKIKQQTGCDSLGVVLGNNLSYSLALQYPKEKTVTRAKVLEDAQAQIPESLDDFNFDWRQNNGLVQVVAVSAKLINNLSWAAKANRLELTHIEPAATLLAGETDSLKEPCLIIYSGIENLLVVCHQGVAVMAETVERISSESVESMAANSQARGLNIGQVVMASLIDKEVELPSQWRVVNRLTDPMATAAKKKKTKLEDKDELSLMATTNPSEPEEAEEEMQEEKTDKKTTPEEEGESGFVDEGEEGKTDKTDDDKEEVDEPERTISTADEEVPTISISGPPQETEEGLSSFNDSLDRKTASKGLLITFVVVLVVGLSLVGGVIYSRSAVDRRTQEAEEAAAALTPSPTVTATPEPEEISLADYSLQVLNGSGIAGRAGEVEGVLEGEGFKNIDVANASSYDYIETIVSLKEAVPEEVFEEIERALNGDYDIKKGEKLSEVEDYDVIITIGVKK